MRKAGEIIVIGTGLGGLSAAALPARAVVAAVEPSVLAKLLPGDACTRRWADAAVPLRAACLDLGARGLPHPERVNVQSLDAPLYFGIQLDGVGAIRQLNTLVASAKLTRVRFDQLRPFSALERLSATGLRRAMARLQPRAPLAVDA